MPWPGLTFRSELQGTAELETTRKELEQLCGQLQGLLSVSLNPDGTLKSDIIQNIINQIINNNQIAHDLLSTTHEDTEPNPPIPGALIVGRPAAGDVLAQWFAGHVSGGVETSNSSGTGKFWFDGHPNPFMGGSSAPATNKWIRKDPDGDVGDVLTLLGQNVEWRTPTGAATQGIGTTVYRSSSQSIAGVTETPIVFDTAPVDDAATWNPATPDLLTIATAGRYHMVGQLGWSEDAGELSARLRVNGVVVAESTLSNSITGLGTTLYHAVEKWVDLAVGDVVSLAAYWNYSTPSGSRTVVGGAASSFLQLLKV